MRRQTGSGDASAGALPGSETSNRIGPRRRECPGLRLGPHELHVVHDELGVRIGQASQRLLPRSTIPHLRRNDSPGKTQPAQFFGRRRFQHHLVRRKANAGAEFGIHRCASNDSSYENRACEVSKVHRSIVRRSCKSRTERARTTHAPCTPCTPLVYQRSQRKGAARMRFSAFADRS